MPEPIIDFIFTDIATELDYTKQMDGMAAGTFISMWGDEITFAPEELQTYVDNTKRVIKSTKTDSGELVGLPIDQDGHDHAGGAGWIKDLSVDEARKVIRFQVQWTTIGLDLIANNIRRFFSPSVNIVDKVILGGSLTNYPASRNAKGQIMLRPVELSQSKSLKEFDMPNLLEQLQALITNAGGATPPPTPPAAPPVVEPAAPPVPPVDLSTEQISPALKSFLADPRNAEELGDLAARRAKSLVDEEKRKMHTVEFAARMVGGTKEKPFGLKVPAKRLVTVLLSLPEAQAREVEKIIEMCLDAAIDFSEHGFDAEGAIYRPELKPEVVQFARDWMKVEGNTIKGFFAANPEIGKMEDFNLAEFMKAKE